MSFKLFIYYCALCGGWAAFLAWAVVYAVGGLDADPRTLFGGNPFLKTALIAGLLGLLGGGRRRRAGRLLNAVGFQRVLRVLVCMGVGFVGGMIGGLIGQVLTIVVRLPDADRLDARRRGHRRLHRRL